MTELGTGAVQFVTGIILFTLVYRGITGKWPWTREKDKTP